MFAGPNGSGKSTLKSVLPVELLGVYLNPDEMEQAIRTSGFLDLSDYGLAATAEEIIGHFQNSSFLHAAGLSTEAAKLRFNCGRLEFTGVKINSYFASVAADFLRRQLLARRISFTLETVMSSPDKVDLLEKAQALGYRTYLYYIATDDAAINISRVRARVKQGGHDVPEEKIVSRYHRSLELLLKAVRHTHRAYVFDNSAPGHDRTWLAEITNGRMLELKTDRMPAWFKRAVMDKIAGATRT